jgi:hypothetical protein
MVLPPWNLEKLISRPDGWLRAGEKGSKRRPPPGGAGGRGSAALAAFVTLKSAVIAGRWDEIFSMLSFRLRREVDPGQLDDFLRRSATQLRKAYRDAEVTAVSFDGTRAELDVDWGRAGFDLPTLAVVEESGGWHFDSLPWAGALVSRDAGTREGEASGYLASRGAERRARLRPSGARRVAGTIALVAVPMLVTLFAVGVHSWYVAGPLVILFGLGLAAALLLNMAGSVVPGRRWSRRHRDRR